MNINDEFLRRIQETEHELTVQMERVALCNEVIAVLRSQVAEAELLAKSVHQDVCAMDWGASLRWAERRLSAV